MYKFSRKKNVNMSKSKKTGKDKHKSKTIHSTQLKHKNEKINASKKRNLDAVGNGQISIDKFAVSASELSRNVSSPKTFDKLAKKKSFTEKQTRTWTVLNEATQEYINDCVDSSIKFILNKATHEGHEIDGIQEILTETVDQIRGMLKTLKAPRNTYGNVKKISKQQRLASEESRIYHGHEETLEEVLREEEKLVIQCEKELKKLQQSRDDKVQLHPFLTNFKPKLDIPSVT